MINRKGFGFAKGVKVGGLFGRILSDPGSISDIAPQRAVPREVRPIQKHVDNKRVPRN